VSLVPVPHPQLSANPALGTPIFPTIFFSLRFFKLRLFITVFLQSKRFFDQPPVFCCSNFFFTASLLKVFLTSNSLQQQLYTSILFLRNIFFPPAAIPDVFIKAFLTTTVEELYPVSLFLHQQLIPGPSASSSKNFSVYFFASTVIVSPKFQQHLSPLIPPPMLAPYPHNNVYPDSAIKRNSLFHKCIDGHNRRWIDGSIPIVSIDTFRLIFIDVIDSLVKDFCIFDR
jgi:hypothetical protein